ncbi:MAG: response regulator [Candidatus Cloacimonadota bacterium]|nr:response regulator [Candidatus Cloacimonadota bacterium]
MKISVLVVDDELLLREVITDFLSKKGYQVFQAENGKQALNISQSNNIDFAFIDIKMPYMSGFILIEKLRNLFPNLEIAIITAFPSLEGVVKAERQNVCEYIAKPFSLEKLHSILQKYVKYASHTKESAPNIKKNNIDAPKFSPTNYLVNRVLNASQKQNIYNNVHFYSKSTNDYKKKKALDEAKKLDLLFEKGDLTLEELNKKKEIIDKSYGKK